MKESHSLQKILRNFSILVLLFTLILAPRPIAGYLYWRRASQLEQSGQFAEAASAYVAAAQRVFWTPILWEKAGDAYLQSKDYGGAEEAYLQALRLRALTPSGNVHRGDAAFAQGRTEFALSLWNQMLPSATDPASLLPRIAQGYQALHDYAAEAQTLEKYLVYRPEDAAAQFRLGLLLAALSPDKAIAHLLQAARIDPTVDNLVQPLRSVLNTAMLSDDAAYQFLVAGRGLGTLGHWDLAETAFKNAVNQQPTYADAWAWLAEAEQQQNKDGKSEIEKAIGLNPDSAMVQSLYGLYLQRQKQPVKALDAFQKAAALEPENAGWQMALGRAYELTDDLVEALKHYQKATELEPKNPATWQALANFSLRDDVDLAGVGLPATRRLVELRGNDWQSLDIAGQVLLEMGDSIGAKPLLEKAIELGPNQAAPILHLALLYIQDNDLLAAHSYLLKAKDLDPEGPYGWQAGRLLEQYFP